MSSTIKTTIFSLIFFSVCCGAYADVLHLKSGDSLEGSVVSESDGKVMFHIEGGEIEFLTSEIDRIERSTTQATASKQQGVKGQGFADAQTAGDVIRIGSGRKRSLGDKLQAFGRSVTSLFSDKKNWNQDDRVFHLWVIIVLHGFLSFFIVGFPMKMYFALFGEDFSYGSMLGFQVKVFIFGIIVAIIIALIGGFLIAALAKHVSNTQKMIVHVIALLGYGITYYAIAKRELDAGFLKAFGLAIVIGLFNFLVAKGMAYFGYGITMEHVRALGVNI